MMEKTRQGEIALELVKYLIKAKGGSVTNPGLGKELLKVANATSITIEELREFLNPLLMDVAKTLVEQSLEVKPEVQAEAKTPKEHGDDGHHGCHGCHCHHGHEPRLAQPSGH